LFPPEKTNEPKNNGDETRNSTVVREEKTGGKKTGSAFLRGNRGGKQRRMSQKKKIKKVKNGGNRKWSRCPNSERKKKNGHPVHPNRACNKKTGQMNKSGEGGSQLVRQ